MDLDWQHIRHMAKWICIFCFEMKGAAMFDWTVLRCNHLICIKCHCGATFPGSAYEYIVTYTHSGKVAAEEMS